MQLSEIKDWIGVISGVGVIGSFVAMLWLRGQFATKSEHEKSAHKIELLEDRVSKTEGDLSHLPDQRSMHRMELSLSDMQGDMKAMTARMKSIAATGERLQEFLVSQARSK